MKMRKPQVVGQLAMLGLIGNRRHPRVQPLKLRPIERIMPNGCRFIAGDPHVAFFGHNPFCDAPRLPGKPYCEEHDARCYTKLPRRAA